jgi:hypothetical protein
VIQAFVTGVGVWAPGIGDATAWLRGTRDNALKVAPAELLPAQLRRRASSLSRVVAEAVRAAAIHGATDVAGLPFVFGSVFGEIGAAVEMIRSFREGEGLPSPTRFHNSVHNTPAAYASIATGNRRFSTAVAAGPDTAAMALLEAMGVLHAGAPEVLVALADEELPTPLSAGTRYAAGAVALVLSRDAGAHARAALRGLRRGIAAASELPAGFGDHPCRGGFALAVAVLGSRAGTIALSAMGDGWVVDVEPMRAA